MPITKVIYERLYPIGSYLNERIGVEISLVEGQDPMEALHEAKKLTDAFNATANPHLQSGPQPQEPEVLPVQQVGSSRDIVESIIFQINDCTDFATLEKTFGPLVKLPKYAGAKSIYDARKAELQSVEVEAILRATNGKTTTKNEKSKT